MSPHAARRQKACSAAPRFVAAALLVCGVLGGRTAWAAADLGTARQALLTGHVDAASSQLHATLAADPANGAASLLLCRVALAEGHVDEAVNSCTAALDHGLSNSSEAQDWTGRALGAKAEKAGPFSGYSLAKRVRAAFERAVELDPHSYPAVNDLAEFYINAPGIVGGGVDKAEALATRVATTAPAAAHRTRALIARKRGDTAAAEREFHAAIDAGRPAAGWIDLAIFLRAQHRETEAADAARQAAAADPTHDVSIVDAASLLTEMHVDDADAERYLNAYLNGSAQSDAAPAFRVHTHLGDLLRRTGRTAAARDQYTAALSLFSGYQPAQTALAALRSAQ